MENLNALLIILMVFLREFVCDESFLSKFMQHDFKIRNTRCDIKSYDQEYINFINITTFKYNRTTVAFNTTFNCKTTLGDKLQVVTQAYKFLSNEYRIFPAIRFQVDLCKAINSNMIGLRAAYNCGNFNNCFFEKNTTYHTCNFVIDETRFPPRVPNGEYMAEVQLIFVKQLICTMNLYLEVYRPIYLKDKHSN